MCPNNSINSCAPFYRDFASILESDVAQLTTAQASTAETNNKRKKDKEIAFPQRLHYVLNEMKKDGLQHIASWQHHGRCFVVHNSLLFKEQILPLWFRTNKLPSFIRQLNMYGFTRITSGPDKGGYYHEMFLRGKAFLAEHIPRRQIRGEGHRKKESPINRPDFKALPSLPTNDALTTSPYTIQSSSQTTQAVRSQMSPASAAPPPIAAPSPTVEAACRLATTQHIQISMLGTMMTIKRSISSGHGYEQNKRLLLLPPALLNRSNAVGTTPLSTLWSEQAKEKSLLVDDYPRQIKPLLSLSSSLGSFF